MGTIKLKCDSDQAPYDQTVREIAVEREDDCNWYGKPIANQACPTLQWPKFAWKEVDQKEGARKALSRSPSPGTNLSTREGEKSMRQNSTTKQTANSTRFPLGQTYITPGAEEALQIAGQTEIEFLRRHMSGDWGSELSEEDRRQNDLSLEYGDRLLSAYRTGKGQKLWIITEADRSATTLLLPSEY